MNSLKQAFRDEIRPDEYFGRVWLTALIAAAVLAGGGAFRGGQPDIANLVPPGAWNPRNPAGELYIEIWATILVNSLQVGLGFWGVVLLGLGVKKVLAANKFVFASFSLGTAFVGFALWLPNCVQPLLQMLVERVPALIG